MKIIEVLSKCFKIKSLNISERSTCFASVNSEAIGTTIKDG